MILNLIHSFKVLTGITFVKLKALFKSTNSNKSIKILTTTSNNKHPKEDPQLPNLSLFVGIFSVDRLKLNTLSNLLL